MAQGMGIRIPMQIYGGDHGEAQLMKVARGAKRVAEGYDKAAASAKRLRQEEAGGGRGGRAGGVDPQARFGRQVIGGFAPLLGASGGMIGRGAGIGMSATGGMGGMMLGGAIGGGFAVAAVAAKIFLASMARAEEIIGESVRRAQGIRKKIEEAGSALGQSGVGMAGSSGLAIQRALASGATMDDIKSAMSRGIDPESLTKVGNDPMAIKAMINAQRFGVAASSSADAIAKNGGVRGSDPWAIAADIAGQVGDRRIGPEELARAKGGSDFGRAFDTTQRLQGQISGTAIDAVTSGAAAGVLEEQLARALDPVTAALKDSYKVYLDTVEQLAVIRENTGYFRTFVQKLGYLVGGAGSASQRLGDEAAKQGGAMAAVDGAVQ